MQKTALVDPSGIVLTETVAQRFFDLDANNYAEALGKRRISYPE